MLLFFYLLFLYSLKSLRSNTHVCSELPGNETVISLLVNKIT